MSARSVSSLSEKREKKCALTTARCVPRASCRRSPPGVRQAGVGAARVVVAGAALQQAVALQSVDQPRQAAARELSLLGQVAHPHAPAARLLQVVQDLVGGHRQPVGPRRAPRPAAWPGRRGPSAAPARRRSSPRVSASWSAGEILTAVAVDMTVRIQSPSSSEHSSVDRIRAGDSSHRRVARQAHSIISGCSGSRA